MAEDVEGSLRNKLPVAGGGCLKTTYVIYYTANSPAGYKHRWQPHPQGLVYIFTWFMYVYMIIESVKKKLLSSSWLQVLL